MDYKYIEQLLERYFACETTLQEEQILRSFFSQEDVPSHLSKFVEIFRYESEASNINLGEDFDTKMMKLIEKESGTKPRIVSIRSRFAPLFKAAAIVAIVLTIGNAAEHSIGADHSNGVDNVTAINPYIKSDEISAAIKVKDNSQAEMKSASVSSDSLLINKTD
ncbi:MAG: pyruvate ferredoxin oxidoreductase [Bacteroidaceae bacterium]|nr:pyruvate ferredoxin oxidoreductase [Bacteroidaceae bacterium]